MRNLGATDDQVIRESYWKIRYMEDDLERMRKQQDRIEAMLIGLCLDAKCDLPVPPAAPPTEGE